MEKPKFVLSFAQINKYDTEMGLLCWTVIAPRVENGNKLPCMPKTTHPLDAMWKKIVAKVHT